MLMHRAKRNGEKTLTFIAQNEEEEEILHIISEKISEDYLPEMSIGLSLVEKDEE